MPYSDTITTAEIREEWNRIRANATTLSDPAILSTISAIQGIRDDVDFYGITGDAMDSIVNHGVTASKTLDVTLGGGEDAPMSTIVANDEDGWLDLPSAFGGDEDYMRMFTDVPEPVSLKITVQINMLADTPPQVIADYGDFVLTAIDAAANMGGSPALSVVHYVNGAINRAGFCKFEIPLVQAGEILDRSAWSAYFSRGGFRMLGFLARAISAKRKGRKLGSGMGASAGPGWNVTRDGDNLLMTCPPRAWEFPREAMEDKLRRVLEKSA